jgi:hypothetical protein
MDAQTLTVFIMGGVVVALGFFGSYMAGLQKEREELEGREGATKHPDVLL